MIKSCVLGVAAAALLAGPALAAPLSTQPAPISVSGNVSLVFIGSDAGDTSFLSMAGGPSNIFCNHSTSGCSAATAGDTVNLGTLTGNLTFQLNDISTGTIFDTLNTASDGYFHAKISADYADLGVFSLPAAASDSINALLAAGSTVEYVGFEDRVGGDYDYNDFVFAIVDPPLPDVGDPQDPQGPQGPQDPTDPSPVPEPASLFLLGAGLAGLAARRRRKS